MPATRTLRMLDSMIDALDAEGERRPLKAVKRLSKAGAPAVGALLGRYEEASKPRQRRWIANALGVLGDRRAIPLLKRALNDPNMSVRLHAMEALERFNDPKLAAFMLPLLKDESGGIRVRTIDALRRMNCKKAVSELRRLARMDAKWYVRQASAEALGELHARSARPELELLRAYPRKAVQLAATKALERLSALK